MEHDRRTFLKTTGLAGAAAIAGGTTLVTAARAQTQMPTQAMARGLVLATLRRADGGYGLGLRAENGILDVIAAEADFHENAPTTITAVLNREGDASGLRRLATKAGERAGGALFRRRGQGAVRPLRHQSGKDRLRRPQLSQAR